MKQSKILHNMYRQFPFSFIGCLLLVLVMAFMIQCKPVIETHKNDVKHIVILGNSIVTHPPAPELGWYGDWGMAASTKDSDFVHRLAYKINKINSKIHIQYASIASFEREYWKFNLDELAQYRNADICILKISENISKDSLDKRQFLKHYGDLVSYLVGDGKTKMIISEGFWPSPVNDKIKTYALSKEYPFVQLQDLYSKQSVNTAYGLFENEGVAAHPSDEGMKQISDRIWKKLKNLL